MHKRGYIKCSRVKKVDEGFHMKVSIASCAAYTAQEARDALYNVLEPLGGLDWIHAGMTIAIKANLVSYLRPEAAATTHPVLLCELVRMIRSRGASVIIGDSPGGLYNHAYVNRIYSVTGMRDTEAAGAELNQDFSVKEAQYPEGKAANSFIYTAWLDKADAIINFCKLKTHGMMGMSAAAKNMFGVIPGTTKPEYHYRFPNAEIFSEMIVDLDEYFKPCLSIVDAVIGMEGNGPTAGTPRHIGVIAASQNPHALDLLCAKLIGISTETVPTLHAAIRRNLCPSRVEELEIIGSFEEFCISDFKLVSGTKNVQFNKDSNSVIKRLTGIAIKNFLASVPKVHSDECIGCSECARICPAKAIQMKRKIPVIQRDKCIRCFCCQEFCPKGAMKVHRPFIARILGN